MSHRRHLLLIVIGSLLLRGMFLFNNRTSLEADPDAYRLISRVISEHGVYGLPTPATTNEPSPVGDLQSADPIRDDVQAAPPIETKSIVPTAYRPPLYPLILALITPAGHGDPSNIAILHLALGILTIALVWLSARAWLPGSTLSAYVAAAIVALDPILLNQSAQVMTETLAACLTMVIVYSASRALAAGTLRWAVIVGCSLGLASLCRPTYLPLVILLPASFLIGLRAATTRDRQRMVWVAAVSMLVALAVVFPWTLRNRLVLGRWIATTTHGGYTLLLGNNDSFYRFLRERRPGEVWELSHPDQMLAEAQRKVNSRQDETASSPGMPESELAREALAYQAARLTIVEQPDSFALACVDRLVQFWRVLPHARSATESPRARAIRWSIGGWYILIFAAALFGLVAVVRATMQRGAKPSAEIAPGLVSSGTWCSCTWIPWGWCVLIILVFQTAHVLYWSNVRMRAPVMPLVALLAAAMGTRLCPHDRS